MSSQPSFGLGFAARRAVDRRDGDPAPREVTAAQIGAGAAVASFAWTITSAFIPAGVVIAGTAVIALVAAIAAVQVLQNAQRNADREAGQ
jgi:hypothetical protein